MSKHPAETGLTEGSHTAGDGDSERPDPLWRLVKAAGAGEAAQLARLLSLLAPPVAATIRVLLGRGHPELEDAVQEAMIAIADSVARFRGESTFLHYARRIAVRTALSLRRAHRESTQHLSVLAAQPAGEPIDPATETGAGIEREQRLEVFRRLLDELPEGQAESLTYRVVLEYSLPAIAHETGVPVNTVRSRIRLARDHLRDRILADPAMAEWLREPP